MKIPAILVGLLAASILLSFNFVSGPAVLKFEDTELATHMKAINKGVRGLQKMLKDAEQKDQAIAALCELEGHALAAKSLVPAQITNIAEEDQGEFMLGFRGSIIELLSAMLEIELAVAEERSEDAVASYKALQKLKTY